MYNLVSVDDSNATVNLFELIQNPKTNVVQTIEWSWQGASERNNLTIGIPKKALIVLSRMQVPQGMYVHPKHLSGSEILKQISYKCW